MTYLYAWLAFIAGYLACALFANEQIERYRREKMDCEHDKYVLKKRIESMIERDVEIVDCPGCGISTFAGTERCPVCSRSLAEALAKQVHGDMAEERQPSNPAVV